MVILKDEPAKDPVINLKEFYGINRGYSENLQIPYNRPERVLWGIELGTRPGREYHNHLGVFNF